jgi:hypothetical protein
VGKDGALSANEEKKGTAPKREKQHHHEQNTKTNAHQGINIGKLAPRA